MGDGPLFSFLILSSYFLLPTSYFLLSSFFFLLCAFAPLHLCVFFFPRFFLLRSRVRSNNRRLELLVYNRIFALSVLGLCCPQPYTLALALSYAIHEPSF
jgi:hypothetical protein